MITKEQLNNWKVKIFNSIKDISDFDQQKLTWLGKHPIYVSSSSETINTLYDDIDFELFIDYCRENEENKPLYFKLVELNKKINKYIQIEKTDIEVLNDSEWKDITLIAQEIIKLWVIG